MDGRGWTWANGKCNFQKLSKRKLNGSKLFGWIGMDMHECAWIDEDGYGGIWTSVDGCEYIWKDMHKYGWTWIDIGKCIFQKLQKRKLNGPLGPLSFLFCNLWNRMEYRWNIDELCTEHAWNICGVLVGY